MFIQQHATIFPVNATACATFTVKYGSAPWGTFFVHSFDEFDKQINVISEPIC